MEDTEMESDDIVKVPLLKRSGRSQAQISTHQPEAIMEPHVVASVGNADDSIGKTGACLPALLTKLFLTRSTARPKFQAPTSRQLRVALN
jgi:hypothetical protein